MRVLKRPNSLFLQGDVWSSVLKTQNTRKTRETKMWITQTFPTVWPTQGCTMSKSMPRAFQKCGTFRYLKVLNQSYWLSKSELILGKNSSSGDVTKKDTASIFHSQTSYEYNKVLTWSVWYRIHIRSQNGPLKPCLFFVTSPIFGDESKISDSVDFEQP